MEIGFLETLASIEINGINVDVISTDRYSPQIKQEIKVNHGDIDHQFHPWHEHLYSSNDFSEEFQRLQMFRFEDTVNLLSGVWFVPLDLASDRK